MRRRAGVNMLQKNLEKHSDMLSGFNLAFDILTENRDNNMFIDSNNNLTRDVIFDNILQQVKPNPINIFQVGAIETFNPSWRIGSGWSDIIFGKYMREYGGKLTIVDIDLDHLANSSLAAQTLGYEVELIYGDAVEHIGNADYNHIYYLDGSNDPKETLDQLNNIGHENCIVIVDDFNIKGELLPREVIERATIHQIANGVAIFKLGETND